MIRVTINTKTGRTINGAVINNTTEDLRDFMANRIKGDAIRFTFSDPETKDFKEDVYLMVDSIDYISATTIPEKQESQA